MNGLYGQIWTQAFRKEGNMGTFTNDVPRVLESVVSLD